MVLVALLTSVDAESHMQKNCTPPNFKDPSDIKSKHKLCTTSRTGSNEQKLLNLLDEGGAGNVQDLVQGIGDRNGEKLINKYLGTLSGGTSPSQDELVAYLQAVGIYVAVPLLFLILNAMCCCTCTCARGVCWICPKCFRCCKCIPNDEHEYSRCSVIRPTIVWFLISIIMFTFAVVGIVLGTYKLVDSTSTSVCLVDDTYLSFQGFLDNVKEPLSLLDTNFKDAVDEMTDATEFPEELDNTVTYLGDSLADVEVWAKVANNSAHSSLPNQLCAVLWEDIVTQSETAKSGTYASAEELNKVLADIQNSIKDNIVDQSAPVSDAISDGVKSINEMSKSIGNILNPENNGLFQVADVSVTQRNNAAFSQWGYVFVVIILAIFGIFGMHKCKHEVNYEPDGRNPRSNPNLQGNAEKLNFIGGCFARMSSCSWCLALSFGILGALFAMLFLPLTVVVSDACPVLKEIPKQLGDIANQPIVQSISDTVSPRFVECPDMPFLFLFLVLLPNSLPLHYKLSNMFFSMAVLE